jgi:hypothetical protein
MATAIFLWITGLGWLGYGLYCFFAPAALSEIAGLSATNTTALVELRAMYGGLQSAVGILSLIGALQVRRTQGVLLTLACLYLGLCSARGVGAVLAHDGSPYTLGALGFETLSAFICLWLLRRVRA